MIQIVAKYLFAKKDMKILLSWVVEAQSWNDTETYLTHSFSRHSD